MQIGNNGNLRRLADRLHEEFADFARVRVNVPVGRGDYQALWLPIVISVVARLVVIMMITAVAVVMRVRRAGYDFEAVVMFVARR